MERAEPAEMTVSDHAHAPAAFARPRAALRSALALTRAPRPTAPRGRAAPRVPYSIDVSQGFLRGCSMSSGLSHARYRQQP